MENKVALIVVFNHRYDNNIEKSEAIYTGRFRNIYCLKVEPLSHKQAFENRIPIKKIKGLVRVCVGKKETGKQRLFIGNSGVPV